MRNKLLLTLVSSVMLLASCGGGGSSTIDYSGHGDADNPYTVDMARQYLQDRLDSGIPKYEISDEVFYVKAVVKSSTGIWGDHRHAVVLEGNPDAYCYVTSWEEAIINTYNTNASRLFNGDPGTLSGYTVTIKAQCDAYSDLDENMRLTGELVSFGRTVTKPEYHKEPKRLDYTLFARSETLFHPDNNTAADNIRTLENELKQHEDEERNYYRLIRYLYEDEESSMRFESTSYHCYCFTKLLFTVNEVGSRKSGGKLQLYCYKGYGWNYDYEEQHYELDIVDGQAEITFQATQQIASLRFLCGDQQGNITDALFSVGFEYAVNEQNAEN